MSSIEELQAKLKEAVALLEAEREAVVRLSTQLAAVSAERNKFEKVVQEINSDATLQARRQVLDASPLDRSNPGIFVVDSVISEQTSINNCRTNAIIHEVPHIFLQALLGNNKKVGKTLFQKVVQEGFVF
ncbi:hypothetical protein TrST_g538, partial [Triparma strigata]